MQRGITRAQNNEQISCTFTAFFGLYSQTKKILNGKELSENEKEIAEPGYILKQKINSSSQMLNTSW